MGPAGKVAGPDLDAELTRVRYSGPRTGWFGKLSGILNSHHFTDGECANFRRRLDFEHGSTIVFNEITGLVAERTKAESQRKKAEKALPI